MAEKQTTAPKKIVTPQFTKQQLSQSIKYAEKRDALYAVLEDDKTYTHDQVDAALQKFYKGGVK